MLHEKLVGAEISATEQEHGSLKGKCAELDAISKNIKPTLLVLMFLTGKCFAAAVKPIQARRTLAMFEAVPSPFFNLMAKRKLASITRLEVPEESKVSTKTKVAKSET